MNVLILIPAYNEEESIRKTLSTLQGVDADILVINDGSTDRTKEMVEKDQLTNPRIRLVSLPLNSGIGAGMQTGYLYAKNNHYDFAIQFDGDGQHNAACIEPMLQHAISNQLDLCIGSRFLEIDSFTSSTLRRVGIRFFSWLIGRLSGEKTTDPTSGFRIAGTRAIHRFAEFYPDDYPEPESLFWCHRNGLKVGEFSVIMHERQGGQSSILYFKTIYYMLKVSTAICIDRLRAKEA